jgi:hypothetical protein
MKISKIKNKIPEVCAATRVIVQHYGHTKKFAKHIVALVIKQMDGLTDVELVDLVGTKIGRIIGYEKRPDYSIFSKVRERAEPEIFEELNNWILQNRLNGRQIRLIAQDSTDVPAFRARISMREPDIGPHQRGKRKIQMEGPTTCSLVTNCI